MEMKEIPEGLRGVLTSDPEFLSGAIRFVETRVPLEIFLDNLEAGLSVDEFLKSYPGVKREQLVAVIGWQNEQTRKTLKLVA